MLCVVDRSLLFARFEIDLLSRPCVCARMSYYDLQRVSTTCMHVLYYILESCLFITWHCTASGVLPSWLVGRSKAYYSTILHSPCIHSPALDVSLIFTASSDSNGITVFGRNHSREHREHSIFLFYYGNLLKLMSTGKEYRMVQRVGSGDSWVLILGCHICTSCQRQLSKPSPNCRTSADTIEYVALI